MNETTLLSAGESIPLGSDAWLIWLTENQKFQYKDADGHFMAQSEIRRGKPYWYGYRRQNGKLTKAYLGKPEELTAARLKDACLTLAGTRPDTRPAAPPTPAIPGASNRFDTSILSITKINGPLLPPHLILRPRLTSQIHTPISLICAPSGFGKSTLLNEWRKSCGFPVAWLSLDEQDNQTVRFWNSVVLSIQTIIPTFGSKTLGYLNGPNPYHFSETVILLLNELTVLTSPMPALGLIFDDVHHIKNAEVLDTLQLCLDHLPPRMHFIFAGRSRPPLAFGHLRAQGLVTELEANDLRFTQTEAAHYIKQYTQDAPLASKDIAKLTKHTEGWAAGLTLSVLAMSRQENQRQFIDTFSGAHIYMREYFLKTVLERTSPEVHYFLLRTSILKHLNGSLCDALTGWQNGEEILAQLWQNNLFIEKLDQQRWYRYHDLFSEMLSNQLLTTHPEEVTPLHRRAAQWYREHYAIADAVNHLLTIQAWEEASGLIEEMALRELEQNGEDSRLLRWLENLPANVVQKHKTLLFVYLSLASSAFSRSKIERFIATIEANLHNYAPAQLSSSEREVLSEIQQLRRAWEQDINQTHFYINRSQDDERWGLYRDFQNLYFTYSSTSVEMAENLPILLERARKSHNLFMILMVGGALGHSAYLEGQIRYAERNARQVLEDAKNMRDTLPETASISLTTLGLVHLVRNEIDLAQNYVNQANNVDPNPTSSNMPILLAVMRSKIQIHLGKFDEALTSLQNGRELQIRHPANTWTEQDLLAYTARVYWRNGDACGAQEILDGSAQSLTHPLSQFVQAEIHYALNKPEASEEILTSLFARCTRLHYEPLFDAQVLLALAQFQQHKFHQASQTLVELIRKAAPERIILPFVERGSDLTTLLMLVLTTENLSLEGKAFIRELLAILPGAGVSPGTNDLPLTALSTAVSISPRQQEILRLTSAGLSVREMAERLCIAESTIKTHLANIYLKLNVNSRVQAMARAQELRLL